MIIFISFSDMLLGFIDVILGFFSNLRFVCFGIRFVFGVIAATGWNWDWILS
jgi:hypothetical protein